MDVEPQDSLDHRLAAALERIGQAARTLLRSAAATERLSTTQAELLLVLHAGDGTTAEPGRLAARLDVTRPTVTDALASLEHKGLVVRQAHATDGRRRRFRVTGHGRETARRLAAWDDQLVQAVGGIPSPQRTSALRASLDVIEALLDSGVVSVARTCTTCRFFREDVRPGTTPHHCALLDAPLGDDTLRVDCPEHEPHSAV